MSFVRQDCHLVVLSVSYTAASMTSLHLNASYSRTDCVIDKADSSSLCSLMSRRMKHYQKNIHVY